MKLLDRVAGAMRRVLPNRAADRLDECRVAVEAATSALDGVLLDPVAARAAVERVQALATPQTRAELQRIVKQIGEFRVPQGVVRQAKPA